MNSAPNEVSLYSEVCTVQLTNETTIQLEEWPLANICGQYTEFAIAPLSSIPWPSLHDTASFLKIVSMAINTDNVSKHEQRFKACAKNLIPNFSLATVKFLLGLFKQRLETC